jgi:hypothetical protein
MAQPVSFLGHAGPLLRRHEPDWPGTARWPDILVDGASSLNLLFLKTFDQMGLYRCLLHPSWAPFHGIVPRTTAMPIGQISLPITFGTRENFQTENIQFEVADFGTVYNAFLGRPALTKFMMILHYTYLVLKIPGSHGVISIMGDVKRAYDCDKQSYEMADGLIASVELHELKESLAEPPPDPVVPDSKTSKASIQPVETLSIQVPLSSDEPSEVGHIGNTLDPKYQHALIKFLQENTDIFAWKPTDMPGVPRELIEHKLHLDP